MPYPPTPNYDLNKPEPGDSMADFETYLNANWDAIADAPGPPTGATLPSAGDYSVGDRFYHTDTQSIYLLACKDANWGWHWRPVQSAISPWVTVPTTCLDTINDGANWNLNPIGNPFQIALDNRGKCYWRGVISRTGGIPRNVSHQLFKPLPVGIKPRERGAIMLGHSPLNVGVDGTALSSFQGARIFLFDNDVSPQSIRCFGGVGNPTHIHLTGINYAVGTAHFTAV